MKRIKVLVVGYYGSDNIGDEILLKATINLLRKTYDNPEITAITYSVKNTEKNHGINGISRNKYFQIIKGIKGVDLVVGGGGSMLQNITSNRSLMYYLAILSLAKIFGKKVVLLGNGIGPLRGKLFIKLTMRILSSLDAIVLRDEESYNYLKSYNLENIYLGNDLAFTLDVDKSIKEEQRKIVINLRKWFYNDEFISTIKKFIEYLSDKGYQVVLLPFQRGNDDVILKSIEKDLNSSNVIFIDGNDYNKIMNEIASCKLFIGMRLHGLIFSSIFNKPFIGLSYDPKVSIFAKKVGQIYFDELNNLTLDSLVEGFNKVQSNIDEYREILVRNVEEILALNNVNEDVIKRLF